MKTLERQQETKLKVEKERDRDRERLLHVLRKYGNQYSSLIS